MCLQDNFNVSFFHIHYNSLLFIFCFRMNLHSSKKMSDDEMRLNLFHHILTLNIGKIRNVSYTYSQSGHIFTTNRDWVCACSISNNFLDLTNFVQNICVTNCKDFKNVLEFDLFLFLGIYSLCQILQKWFFAKMLFIFFFNICLLMSFLILLCKQVWWKRNPILSKRGMLFPQ